MPLDPLEISLAFGARLHASHFKIPGSAPGIGRSIPTDTALTNQQTDADCWFVNYTFNLILQTDTSRNT